jgi:BON domain
VVIGQPGGQSKGGRELSEYREKRTVVQDVPVGSSRPVVETRYDSVVDERRGMSGVAVAALVVAAITAAVVITMLIINGQQRNSDAELAQERAIAAQQTPAQPAQQQPVIVNVPPSQPATVAVPYPVPGPSQPAPADAKTAPPSSANIETDVTSRLQNDEELRSYTIDVKVTGGTAILSGQVPDEHLKRRAEKLARAVTGVQSVMNDIAVNP